MEKVLSPFKIQDQLLCISLEEKALEIIYLPPMDRQSLFHQLAMLIFTESTSSLEFGLPNMDIHLKIQLSETVTSVYLEISLA